MGETTRPDHGDAPSGAGERPAERLAESEAPVQAGKGWCKGVDDQRHHRDRQVGEEVLRGMGDAVVSVSRPEKATSNSSS